MKLLTYFQNPNIQSQEEISPGKYRLVEVERYDEPRKVFDKKLKEPLTELSILTANVTSLAQSIRKMQLCSK